MALRNLCAISAHPKNLWRCSSHTQPVPKSAADIPGEYERPFPYHSISSYMQSLFPYASGFHMSKEAYGDCVLNDAYFNSQVIKINVSSLIIV